MAIIKKTIDLKNPPKVAKADLDRIDAIHDDDIDYSDIPELGDGFFEKATTKEQISARFDRDMLDWYRAQGRGYQTKMNAVLRAFYEQHQQSK